jgi:hypothetical protein
VVVKPVAVLDHDEVGRRMSNKLSIDADVSPPDEIELVYGKQTRTLALEQALDLAKGLCEQTLSPDEARDKIGLPLTDFELQNVVCQLVEALPGIEAQIKKAVRAAQNWSKMLSRLQASTPTPPASSPSPNGNGSLTAGCSTPSSTPSCLAGSSVGSSPETLNR